MAITKENLTATITVETGDSNKNLDQLAENIGVNVAIIKQFQKSVELLNETLNPQKFDELTKAIENQNKILERTDKLFLKYEANLNRSSDSSKQFQETTETLSEQVNELNSLFSITVSVISAIIDLENRIVAGELDSKIQDISKALSQISRDRGFDALSDNIEKATRDLFVFKNQYIELRTELLKNLNLSDDQKDVNEETASSVEKIGQFFFNLSVILKTVETAYKKVSEAEQKLLTGEFSEKLRKLGIIVSSIAWDRGFRKLAIAILYATEELVKLTKRYVEFRKNLQESIKEKNEDAESMYNMMVAIESTTAASLRLSAIWATAFVGNAIRKFVIDDLKFFLSSLVDTEERVKFVGDKIAESFSKVKSSVSQATTASTFAGFKKVVSEVQILAQETNAPFINLARNATSSLSRVNQSIENSKLLLLAEYGGIASIAFTELGRVFLKTDETLKKGFGLTLIAVGVALGGVTALIYAAIDAFGGLAFRIGSSLINAMEEFEKIAKKSEATLSQFNFTIEGFGRTLGTENIGTIGEWSKFITNAFNQSTFSLDELRKSVKLLVAEGSAIGLDFQENIKLMSVAMDIAAANGAELNQVIVAIAQGLSGTQQTSLLNYGINLQETALAHSILTLEMGKTVSEMNEQEKLQLRLGELYKQTIPILGSAALQTTTWQGKIIKLNQTLDILKAKLGQSGTFTALYNNVLISIASTFANLPDPIIYMISTFMDLGGVLLQTIGFFTSMSLTIIALASGYTFLTIAIQRFAIVATTLNAVFAALNIAIGANIVAVTSAATLFSNIFNIAIAGTILLFKNLGTYLLLLAKNISVLTVALLANPLFLKASAIVIGIYSIITAIQELNEELGILKGSSDQTSTSFDWLYTLGNFLKNTFSGIMKTLVSLTKIFIQGFIGFAALFAKIYGEILSFIEGGTNEVVEKSLNEIDDFLVKIGNNIESNFLSIASSFTNLNLKAKAFGKNLNDAFTQLKLKALEEINKSINKSAIETSILGDSYEILASRIAEAKNIQKESSKNFLAGVKDEREQLDKYEKAIRDQYQAEAEISRLRKDTIKELQDITRNYTIEQLRSSGKIIEAINLEYQERSKELSNRIELLKKIGNLNDKELKDISLAQAALERARQSEIKAYIDKRKQDALDKIKDSLKEEQKLLQDIEDKNSDINRAIITEGLTARQAIIAQLEYQIALIDKQIERAIELYGANSEVVQALQKQKALLEAQSKIDMKKLLPELPSEIIGKFWEEFVEGGKARWNRLKESFTNIKMPSMSFEGMADFGKQLFSAGETLGVSIAEGASVIFSYAAIAIDIIKQAPDFLRSAFLELPYIILDALTQLPAIIDEIIAKFPDIIAKIADNIGPLLLQIAMKIDDLMIMLLEQLPILIEKIAEALPEIIITLIKNIPRMLGAILKAIINSVIGFIRGLGRGIMGLLTGKGIKLDKIVDTKGMESKIKKLTGETGRLFSVENLMEAAKDPVQAIYDVVEGASKKAANYLKEAWNWIMDNIIQPIFDGLKAVWMFIYDKVIMPIYNFVRNAWLWVLDNVLRPIYNIVRDAWLWVYNNIIAPIANVISSAWQWVVDNVINPLMTIGQKIAEPIQKIIDNLLSAFSSVFNAVTSILQPILDALKSIRIPDWLKDLKLQTPDWFDRLKIKTPEWFDKLKIQTPEWLDKLKIGGGGGGGGGISIPPVSEWFASGGPVYAQNGLFVPRGTDTVPAMLTPGEFVMSRRGVEANGLGLLSAMNRGQTAGAGDTYVQIEINVDAKTTMDEGYIRGTLIPKMSEELRRASLDGRFVISSRGIR